MTNCKVLIYQQEQLTADDASKIQDPISFDQLRNCINDGAMFSSLFNTPKNISFYIFQPAKILFSDLSQSLAKFQVRNSEHLWGRPRYNFLYLTTYHATGQPIDWMTGDIDTLVNNFKVAAQYSKAAGFLGIFFDSQGTNMKLWKYAEQPSANKYSLAQYQTRVYEIAKQIVGEWLRINPNMQIMFDAGYPQYYAELEANISPNLNIFGLWKAWLDGFFDGMGEFFGPIYNNIQSAFGRQRVVPFARKIILSTREGFSVQDAKFDTDYDAAMAKLKGTYVPKYRGGSAFFDKFADFALGMMVDYTNRDFPVFINSAPNSNYHTPKGVKNLLMKCLANDNWCWFFAQRNFYYWFSPILNSAYTNAIRDARDEYFMW